MRTAVLAFCLAFAGLARLAFADEIVQPPSRDVTPPDFTPAERVTTPLFREPVPPLPPPPPEGPRWHLFFLPETSDPATFEVKGMTIRLVGVSPPAADRTCADAGGESWPCGHTALYSLRMFLHGRAIECYFSAVGQPQVTAPCRVGGADLGLWLLSEGWADPAGSASEQYRAAALAAHCARLGLWRDAAPAANCPG